MPEDQQFYVSQKAIITKGESVLIMHDPEFGSDFPGGKIQEGQLDFVEELKREVQEETGLTISVGQAFATGYFELPQTSKNKNAGRKIFNVYYTCTYVSGTDQLSDEHDRFDWVTRQTFQQIVNQDQEREILARYFALHPDALIQQYIKRRSHSHPNRETAMEIDHSELA